jgi:hypothetical protein
MSVSRVLYSVHTVVALFSPEYNFPDLLCTLDIYGPMIYTAPYIVLSMRSNPVRGQVGGGWALEIEPMNQSSIGSLMYMSFLGP